MTIGYTFLLLGIDISPKHPPEIHRDQIVLLNIKKECLEMCFLKNENEILICILHLSDKA